LFIITNYKPSFKVEPQYPFSNTVKVQPGSAIINGILSSTFDTDVLVSLGHTFVDIIPLSVKIYYKIAGSTFLAVDSGAGLVFGTGLTGTLDYNTGLLSLSTTLNPSDDLYELESTITIMFDYYKYSDITVGQSFYADYKLVGAPEITEIGLEDANNNVLVYATFPIIQQHSTNDYLSANIMMKLT